MTTKTHVQGIGLVDLNLLRAQRDELVAYNDEDGEQPSVETIEGVINLLDTILIVADAARD